MCEEQRKKKITIKYDPPRHNGLRWYMKPGYVWNCPCCKVRGRNSFDLFSRPRWHKDYLHPWVRCVISVDVHIQYHHPPA